MGRQAMVDKKFQHNYEKWIMVIKEVMFKGKMQRQRKL